MTNHVLSRIRDNTYFEMATIDSARLVNVVSPKNNLPKTTLLRLFTTIVSPR